MMATLSTTDWIRLALAALVVCVAYLLFGGTT